MLDGIFETFPAVESTRIEFVHETNVGPHFAVRGILNVRNVASFCREGSNTLTSDLYLQMRQETPRSRLDTLLWFNEDVSRFHEDRLYVQIASRRWYRDWNHYRRSTSMLSTLLQDRQDHTSSLSSSA